MKPLSEWTEADLQELVGTDEGQSVDFKRSDSINFAIDRDKRVKELVKDVSAMANAAGGRIFYGIVEEKGTCRAERLDDGLAAGAFNLDQISNLLTSNIEPSISGVTTHAIPLANGRFAIAIDIPQSMNLAPHQSRLDRLYHRRHDRKTLAMFDHEIRDVMRRAVVPRLTPEFIVSRENNQAPFNFEIVVRNLSNEPAMFYIVDIGIDGRINLLVTPAWGNVGDPFNPPDKRPIRLFQKAFIPPNAVPLFKPRPVSLFKTQFNMEEGEKYRLQISMSCAGFHDVWDGEIWVEKTIMHFDLKQASDVSA